MAKTRKPLTPEQKERNAANLAKAREARKANKEVATPQQPISEQVAEMVRIEMQRLMELNAGNLVTPAQKLRETGAMVGNNGIQGVQFKYSVDKNHYPDPTERLMKLPELKRFGMEENYLFTWDVEGVTYETHNITYSEPRFILELHQIMYDPETGEDTLKRIVHNRIMLEEDEFYARLVASQMGLDTGNFDELMNEVRFIQMKRWLIGVFHPPQFKEQPQTETQQVINGKVVKIIDTTERVNAARGMEQAAAVKRETRVVL